MHIQFHNNNDIDGIQARTTKTHVPVIQGQNFPVKRVESGLCISKT